VGKTSQSVDTVGGEILSTGIGQFTVDGNFAGRFTRQTSDGDIVVFRKGTGTVGSIASFFGNLMIGKESGARIAFSSTGIYSSNNSGTTEDASYALGTSSSRFTDLYLSGGVYLGGTGAANKLDDYEYGDYQVSLTTSGGGSITVSGSHDDLKYTKIGSRVFVSGKIDISAASSPTGYIKVTLPFVIHNSGTVNDSRRFTGSIWVINSALNTYEFQLYGVEGESVVRIYNGSGTSLASTSANQFSGDEGICFDFHYETTP